MSAYDSTLFRAWTQPGDSRKATATIHHSTTQAATATIGLVRSTPATATTPTTCISTAAIATRTTTTAIMGDRFVGS